MAEGVDPTWQKLAAYAAKVGPILEQVSYYQLLGIPETADLPTLRAAFYRQAANLHPDRYLALGDPETRALLGTIYARIAEGYRVLSNPQRRAAYDKGLAGGKHRLQSSERERRGPQNPEEAIAHPEAKKFFRLAQQCAARKDWKGAIMNLRFARNFDKETAIIAEKLAEAEAAARGP